MNREVEVYISLQDETIPVGRLRTRAKGGRQGATFEYLPEWLQNPLRFSLEPGLLLGPGPQHTHSSRALFGALGDSAPDRWGRILMRRAQRIEAQKSAHHLRTLLEIDFLLGVDDEARQGALRFKTDPKGPFLAAASGSRIPPLVELPRLLSAAERVVQDEESEADLRLLLAPGSSLGGARPKASVRDKDGSLGLAKFPSHYDEIDTVLWEAVALELARRAGIVTPEWRLLAAGDKKVLFSRRFDRSGNRRIPFLSAMSMLGRQDGDSGSYLEIADSLRQYGAQTTQDQTSLWRRIVFNILISNTDDHLRNHGFLYSLGKGWRLSPAYDLNPTPVEFKPRFLSTAIDLDDSTASLDLAFQVADYFGLRNEEAKRIASEVGKAVSCWRETARFFALSTAEIDRMASAFEHSDLEQALQL